MSDEEQVAYIVDSTLEQDEEYVYAERLRQHLRGSHVQSTSSAARNALLQRVHDTTEATRTAHEYRTHTNAMIRVGLQHEQRLNEQWRAAEAKARSLNRAAERAALTDLRETFKDMYALHRSGRQREVEEKEREMKQHLDEANAARASRMSLYGSRSNDGPGVPTSLREMRSIQHQSDKVVVAGSRPPLFDATPDVNEFQSVMLNESHVHRISTLQGLRSFDPPSHTLPHTMPKAMSQLTRHTAVAVNTNSNVDHLTDPQITPSSNHSNNQSVPTSIGNAEVMTIPDYELRSDPNPILPSLNQPLSNSTVVHPKPFTTSSHQVTSNARAAAMYRSKLPMFTQSEGNDMLNEVCLFTVNQSRDQHVALELERRAIEERDRQVKAQWIVEEQNEQREKLLIASKSGLLDLTTDPTFKMLNSLADETIKSSNVIDETKECTEQLSSNENDTSCDVDEHDDEVLVWPRPSSCCSDTQSTVQFQRPVTSSGSVNRVRGTSSHSSNGVSHSRPVTQSTRLFPVAQVKSRWQHAAGAGRSDNDPLTRRFNQSINNKSRPGSSINQSDQSTSPSNIAVAFTNDPLHSNFLRDQRVQRAHATSAVFDTVKTWLEQQEETRKRRVSLEAAQSSKPVNQSSVFHMDNTSPFEALLSSSSQNQLSPRTLKRQAINLSRAPLSSSNSAVFRWLRKHAIIPARTVKPIEEIRYRSVFAELDMDSSGMLDENELLTAIQATHSLNFTQDELRSLLQSMDIRFDGKLSFTQFVNQFASIDEWESLFKLWRKRKEERVAKSQNQNPSTSRKIVVDTPNSPRHTSRQLQSPETLSDDCEVPDVSDVLVPFLLWVPAYHRLRLLDSLIALQLTPQEEITLKQQAHVDAHTVSQSSGDRPQTSTGGLSLLDLWRVTRTQVKRRRIEADAAEAATMQQVMDQQRRGKSATKQLNHTELTSSDQLEEIMHELDIDRANRSKGRRDLPAVRDQVADRAFELFKQAVEGTSQDNI